MPDDIDAEVILDEILLHDDRYARQAYYFIMEALKHTLQNLQVHRHVTGQELSLGIRDYAIQQFGMIARLVFEQWGITRTRDFGEIVFNLVTAGLMRKTDEDSVDDFNDVYDFEKEFETNYRIEVDKSSL
ncbi:MAG: hypothetical protein HY710_15235 [Candidatus Latescibacteria bacterium]|nr:hypothetical protein [Candidatus Latescibacterota bacterium]